MRIVSLLPAATEICFALGLGDAVVGVSPECDFPPAALERPALSRAVLGHEARTSAETSELVGARLAAGEALYAIDEAGLRDASPELILTQGLCDVCAPSYGDVREVASRLPSEPEVLSLDPHRLQDILADIVRVGRAAHADEAAEALVADLRERVARVAARADRAEGRPSVLCLEWMDPLFVAGHWVPEMVGLAGGEDAFGRAGEKSVRIEARDIALAAPEVAVLMPCGFHMDRVEKEASLVAGQAFWRDLPAVRRDRVWLVDASSYFSRPGPRVVAGLEILAHIVHPKAFPRRWPADVVRPWTG
jgi:iron complex transport system substrate-binding protein